MEWKKLSLNKYKSPNGIIFTEQQMDSYKKRLKR